MNSTIKPKPCKTCQSPFHSAMWHKPRKPIKHSILFTPNSGELKTKPRKRIKQQSDKEKQYQVWKETVARPYLILQTGNRCACCHQYFSVRDTLDIDHIVNKGSHPELKRDLDNLQLLCRVPCHTNKTNGVECSHV